MPAKATKAQTPVVVYGALRSGTTMFRLMLDAHPSISCPGERDFMLDYLKEGENGLILDSELLSMERIFQASGLSLPKNAIGNASFFELLEQQDPGEVSTLALMMHRNLDRLLDILPEVRIIHFVRDPRDVAKSSIKLGWAGNTYYGINHWIKTEREWHKSMGRMAENQVLMVSYEDMVQEPEIMLTKVCKFVGQEYDPKMLEFHRNTTYSAVNPSLGYQWKQKQSPREISLVEHKIGSLLQLCGYEPSGHAAKPPSNFEKLALWVQNKTLVWRSIFKRYGIIDPILLRVARKIGRPQWARSARQRINKRQSETLK